jgi:hypothetical protein
MPFKDPEAQKAYLRDYYRANRAKHIERVTAWKAAHPDKVRESSRKWYETKGREYRAARREGIRAYQRAWDVAHPGAVSEANRVQRLRHKYGLTVAEYEAMLARQQGVCACCQKSETHRARNGEVSRLAVDHDHVTGSIRALLCHSCNTGIGSFYDDPTLLRAAAEYIEGFRLTG